MSARSSNVNLYFNNRARYGISFGLIYFLFCAITLDSLLQRYWGSTGRRSDAKLGSLTDIEDADRSESRYVELTSYLIRSLFANILKPRKKALAQSFLRVSLADGLHFRHYDTVSLGFQR